MDRARKKARDANPGVPEKFACREVKRVFDEIYWKLPLQALDFGSALRSEGT